MSTFDPQAKKLLDKAEALQKQSDELRAKAEAVLAKKYGQLGALFADRANDYLPSKKKDWKPFIDRVVTVYEESLKVEVSEEIEETEEAVASVAEQQLEAAEEILDEMVAESDVEDATVEAAEEEIDSEDEVESEPEIETKVETDAVEAEVEPETESIENIGDLPQVSPAPVHAARPSGNYDGDNDILGRSRTRQTTTRSFPGGLNMPDGW